MNTSLTIRNLDESVKRKLRLRAALHQRSMEAEARAILAESLAEESPSAVEKESARLERHRRIESVVGMWRGRYDGKSTDEIMRELRGDDG